tara:strand:- start:1770 stop:1949 length:180 start_codon:yes stop_codon:yes gene_type:complete
MKINVSKADQELIDKMNWICSDDIHATPEDVAKILEVSNDKVKDLIKINVANAPEAQQF